MRSRRLKGHVVAKQAIFLSAYHYFVVS